MKISQLIGSTLTWSSAITLSVISAPLMANAASFSFSNINGGDTVGDALNGGLSLSVEQTGANLTFKFFNNITSPTNTFIGTIYIDAAPALLGASNNNISFFNASNPITGNDIGFSGGLSNANFPQGNIIGFSTDYAFDANNGGGNKYAIQNGEALGITFAGVGTNYASVVDGLNNGTFRVGYHLQNVFNSSDSYVSTKPVPVPSLLFGIMAAGALGGSRLLKNKKQSA